MQIDYQHRQSAHCENGVTAGLVSHHGIAMSEALAFHMARNQMDTALLAQYMGLPRWRVWLHRRPWGFKRLTTPQLANYAVMLRTRVAELKDISLVAAMQIPGREPDHDAD